MKNNVLIEQLKAVMPPKMTIPKEIEQLYDFIEENGLYVEKNGYRYGLLFPEDRLRESWNDDERDGGTIIYFCPGDPDNFKYWFGVDLPEIRERLCVFAQSGAEGSECAFWLNDNNELKIVHLGSGSGSILTCVLADKAVDFLRLLAIGYDEICRDEDFPYPPNEGPDSDLFVKPNLMYRKWVEDTFNVTIPETALEIVKHPTTIESDSTEDEFLNWVNKFIG